jgi:hypothetical protein
MDFGVKLCLLKTRLYPLGFSVLASVEIVLALLLQIKAYPRQLPYAVFTDLALLGQLPLFTYSCGILIVLRFSMFIVICCHLYSYLIHGYEFPVSFNLKHMVKFSVHENELNDNLT